MPTSYSVSVPNTLTSDSCLPATGGCSGLAGCLASFWSTCNLDHLNRQKAQGVNQCKRFTTWIKGNLPVPNLFSNSGSLVEASLCSCAPRGTGSFTLRLLTASPPQSRLRRSVCVGPDGGDQLTCHHGSRRKFRPFAYATPGLQLERHDVIMPSHSYSGKLASAAARDFEKADRAVEGKTTSVVDQVFIASILPRGGDWKDVMTIFEGQLPPHIYAAVGCFSV